MAEDRPTRPLEDTEVECTRGGCNNGILYSGCGCTTMVKWRKLKACYNALKSIDHFFPATFERDIFVQHPGILSLHSSFKLDLEEFEKLATMTVVIGRGANRKQVQLWPSRGHDWGSVLQTCDYGPSEITAVVEGKVVYGAKRLGWINFSLKPDTPTPKVPHVERIKTMWSACTGAGIDSMMAVIARRIGTQFEDGPQASASKRLRAAEEQQLAETSDTLLDISGAVISALVEVTSEAVKEAQDVSEAAQSSTAALGSELYLMRLRLEESQSEVARLRKHIQQNCIDISEISQDKKHSPSETAKLTNILDTIEREVAYGVYEVPLGRRIYLKLRKPEEEHARASIKTQQRNRAQLRYVRNCLKMPDRLSAVETRTLMTAGGFGVKAAQRINMHLRSLGFEHIISPAKAVRSADAAAEVTGVGVYETTLPGGNEEDGIQRVEAVVITQDLLQLLQLEVNECFAKGQFRDINLGGYGPGSVYMSNST